MSIFIPTNTENPRESAHQIEFRRQLDAIPSWSVRAQKIEDRLQETTRALAVRDEQLFALRGDFDALTMDFWNAFARTGRKWRSLRRRPSRAFRMALHRPPGLEMNHCAALANSKTKNSSAPLASISPAQNTSRFRQIAFCLLWRSI